MLCMCVVFLSSVSVVAVVMFSRGVVTVASSMSLVLMTVVPVMAVRAVTVVVGWCEESFGVVPGHIA